MTGDIVKLVKTADGEFYVKKDDPTEKPLSIDELVSLIWYQEKF